MNSVFFIALAPIFIIAVYVYYRDKWEKEPVGLLLLSIVVGAIISLPVIWVEQILKSMALSEQISSPFYNGFVVAGFTEEGFKLLAFILLIWNNKNFDEKFDGIVYAVYISLGFAMVENLMYVFHYGIQVAYVRAFTAVPLHALVAVVMGYHLGLAKMGHHRKMQHLLLALVLPILFHGFYDWILMIHKSWYLLVYVPFLYFLWRRAFRHINELSEKSRFNPKNNEWTIPKDFFRKK